MSRAPMRGFEKASRRAQARSAQAPVNRGTSRNPMAGWTFETPPERIVRLCPRHAADKANQTVCLSSDAGTG